MKSSTMVKLNAIFILLASSLMQSISLAYVDPVTPPPADAVLIGNAIQIVPTTTSASDFADCDSRGQDKAYYVGSPVAMKVQALPQGSNKRIVSTSRILKYDPYDVFNNLSFPTISNIVPTTTITQNKAVIVADVNNTTFKQPATSYARGQLAAQLMSNMHYQGISTTSTSNPVNYTYLLLNAPSSSSLSLNSNNFIQVIQQTYVCFNYYLAYCGDGVKDNYVAGGNGDGINGIMVAGSIVPWHGFTTATNPPAEQCDDGNTVSGDGCSSTCQNENVGPPTCFTFNVSPTTGTTTTTYDLSCLGTNATSYEISITNNGTALPGTPLTLNWAGPFINPGFGPMPAGNNVVTCTVFGANGASAVCPVQTIPVGTVNVNTNLQITKSLVPNPLVPDGKYHPGDTVTFRIDFANIGTSAASNARVRDVFPNSLTHILTGDQLVGIQAPYNHGTYSNGTNEVIEYSGFYLPAGATGYMIVQGVAKGYEFGNETYNHTYVISDNAPIKDAHLYFDYALPNANITIAKTLTTAWPFYPGSTFWFTLTLQNNGDTVNNLQVQDIWPTGPCIIPSNNYTSNIALQSNGNYSWILNGAFNAGQTLTIHLTGQIDSNPACAAPGSYTNLGTYSYVLVGVTHTGSASAAIPVAPTPYANIDFQKTVLQAGSNKWDTVSYKIIYKNNGTTPLGSFVVSDFWPATLNYVSASPLPFNPPVGNSCVAGCTLNRYINTALQPGSLGEIILTGTIK